jgi:Ca2+-binding RTX toxin-like protein
MLEESLPLSTYEPAGETQGLFASSYTNWLTSHFTTQTFSLWLESALKYADIGEVPRFDAAAIEDIITKLNNDAFTVDINQNSDSAAPQLVILNSEGVAYDLSAYTDRLFEGPKEDISWTSGTKKQVVTHTRYYEDDIGDYSVLFEGIAPNQAPTATDDLELTVQEDAESGVVGNVLDNDSDAEDGQPVVLAFTVEGTDYGAGETATLANGATLTIATSGEVTLVQNGKYNGLDGDDTVGISFSYTVVDSEGETDSADALITVQGVEDPTVVASPLQDKQVNETETLVFAIPATTFADPDTPISNYVATLADGTALPAWLLFDDETLTFTVTAPDVATDQTLQIKVSAEGSNTISDILQLTVKADATDVGPADLSGFELIEGTGTESLSRFDDKVIGDSAGNTINGNNGNDTIYGMGGGDTLRGNNFDDQLYGGEGGDTLEGMNGNDQLFGGSGADILIGGGGADQLYGGFGSDVFTFNADDSTAITMDVIHDFVVGMDRIDVTNLDGNLTVALNWGGEANAPGVSTLAWYSDGIDTFVVANLDANPGNEFMLKIVGQHALQQTDFML